MLTETALTEEIVYIIFYLARLAGWVSLEILVVDTMSHYTSGVMHFLLLSYFLHAVPLIYAKTSLDRKPIL